MANRVKMAMVDAVLRLLQQGWSYRRIGRELGIHRDTVARLAGKSKPAKAPLGAEQAGAESKPAKAPLGADNRDGTVSAPVCAASDALAVVTSNTPSRQPSPSQEKELVEGTACGNPVFSRSACEPFRSIILVKLEQALSGQRIYQDLVVEHGYRGSYYSVRRFVSQLREPE